MSGESFQERTEQATPKRLEDARRKGQVARSRELTGAAVVIAGILALWLAGGWMLHYVRQILELGLVIDAAAVRDGGAMLDQFGRAVKLAFIALAPVMLACAIAAVLAPLATGGLVFSFEPLVPKAEKFDPVKGLGRLFSLRSLVELGKTLTKFVLVAGVAGLFLWWYREEIFSLGRMPLRPALVEAASLGLRCLLLLGLALLLIGVIDAPYQFWDHRRKMRMTRQEVREEHKESEGSPEVKGRIRSMQQAIANRRMLAAVPEADAVVTNPTHYAVALRYAEGKDAVPRVIAKGVDEMALRIRAVARKHRVPVLEAPPLARALHRSTALDATIPRPLYEAVAQVLGWVYQLREARRKGGAIPPRPNPRVNEEEFSGVKEEGRR